MYLKFIRLYAILILFMGCAGSRKIILKDNPLAQYCLKYYAWDANENGYIDPYNDFAIFHYDMNNDNCVDLIHFYLITEYYIEMRGKKKFEILRHYIPFEYACVDEDFDGGFDYYLIRRGDGGTDHVSVDDLDNYIDLLNRIEI